MLCFEAQFNFHLLNKSLATDAIDLDPLVSASTNLRVRLYEIVATTGDVPDKA
jgi:hypothetical protein